MGSLSAYFYKEMRFLFFSFSLFIIFIGLAFNAFSQQVNIVKQGEDWSALFPEIPNCERIIQPITQKGEIFEQTAVYERQGYQKYKNEQNYFRCGSITIRFAPSARKSARKNFTIINFPMTRKFQVKTFEAYRNTPRCGNDVSIGSTEVYFDEDKVLSVSAYIGAQAILDFALNADYELMKKSMSKLIKSKAGQK